MAEHDLQDDLIDLRGDHVIPQAIDARQLADLDRCYDQFPALDHGQW